MNNVKQQVLKLAGKNSHIILGLSGGPDSVFLFHILKELHKSGEIKLTCAHLNHMWRDDSDKDEKFCRDLCINNGIKIVTRRDNGGNIKYNGSKEEVGRKLRRAFFKELLKKEDADHIALAHHFDDQQETFLWRIIRGTTLSGLTGIKEADGVFIRPLINISKANILKFLDENGLSYIVDSSNDSQNFLRNRIRKNVIPALRDSDERFDKKFFDTLTHLQSEETLLQELTNETYSSVFENGKGSIKKLTSLHPALQKRVLIKWLREENVFFDVSNAYLEEVIRFLFSPRGGTHKLNNWVLNKKQKKFWIVK